MSTPDAVIRAATPGSPWREGPVATHEDITERQRLHMELQQRSEQLDAALKNMAYGLSMFDAGQRLVIVNDRYREIYGLTQEQVKPGTPFPRVIEWCVANGFIADVAPDQQIRERLGSSQIDSTDTYRFKDGRLVTVLRRRMPGGGWLATHEDITEQRRMQLALEQSHSQLEEKNSLLQQQEKELQAKYLQLDAALENITQGLCVFDSEQKLVVSNEHYRRMYGLPPELVTPGTTLRQVLEHRVANGVHSAHYRQEVEANIAHKKSIVQNVRLSDGRVIALKHQPLSQGGWVATHEDITEREQLSTRLRQQREQLDIALGNMSQGLAMFDRNQRIIICNKRFADMYRLTLEQVKPGTALREIVEHRIANGIYAGSTPEEYVRERLAPVRKDTDVIHRLSDGRIIALSVRVMPDGSGVATHHDITEREHLKERLDAALNNMAQGLAMFDAEQRIVLCNTRFAQMYGLSPTQVESGTAMREILNHCVVNGSYAGRDPDEMLTSTIRHLGSKMMGYYTTTLSTGQIYGVSVMPMSTGGIVTTHEDITLRHHMEAALEQSNRQLSEHNRLLQQREDELCAQNQRFDAAIENMPQGLSMFDCAQRVVVCNRRYAEMYGLELEQVNPGTTLREIIEHRIAKGLYAGPSPVDYLRERLAPVAKDSDNIQVFSDGRVIALSTRVMPDGGFVTTHADITERRRIEARIAYLAHHDALTDLPNRVLLRERLEQTLTSARRDDKAVAVLCLDLDRFKEVNDTLGHAVGDELLKAVGMRLRTCAQENEFVARLGGDEFAIVMTTADPPRDAAALAGRIIVSLTAPHVIDGHQLAVGTSIGIAVAPSDADRAEALLQTADLALYGAKGDGRGTYRFFEPEMNTRMQTRRALETDLRKALEHGQLMLHYQPLLHLESDQICGCEALLRWNHPERGRVSPADFIPVAESTGLIVPIGEWVLREACREAAAWPAGIKVAVNLSAIQFKSPNLVRTVVSALAASGLSPGRLELEITESVLIGDSKTAVQVLEQLRAVGVQIALDDFGTGYSSLSYLHSFPFDKIKIDRCFVSNIANECQSALAIIRTITQLGRSLGMATTAEGVETQEQLELVRAEGCTEMQGYLLSPPIAAEAFRQFLPQHRACCASAA